MNLHENEEVFTELVEVTAETIGLPQLYVEKDYWVTNALKLLSKSPYMNEVVFKGGTSLSKAYHLIERFSEDIDLAIFAGGKSDGARKKLLKTVEGVMTQGIVSVKGDARESKGSNFRKTVYQYPKNIDGVNFGQASPELIVEINAFTNPEPFKARNLQTLIAEVLSKKGELDLITQYGLEDFSVNVLSVERTLVEKILGVIKDSYSDDPVAKLSNRIRHLYDICSILKHDVYRNFIAGDEFEALCHICIEDEKNAIFTNTDYFQNDLKNAPLFFKFIDWHSSLDTTYTGIFSELVYGDLPVMEETEESIIFIKQHIK